MIAEYIYKYKDLVEAQVPPLNLLHQSWQLQRLMAEKESDPSPSQSQSHSQSNQQQQHHPDCDPNCQSFGQKCSHLVKKQRTKFYILRRCIAMLLCWHERADHWAFTVSSSSLCIIISFYLKRVLLLCHIKNCNLFVQIIAFIYRYIYVY